MYCNKRLGSPCRNEVQKGKYCDKLIGKKDCERECVSREGLGVSEDRVDGISYLLVGHRLEIERRR